MKITMEAKVAIVTSAGRKPPAPGIFYTAKEWILSEIISSINLRNGPEIQNGGMMFVAPVSRQILRADKTLSKFPGANRPGKR